MNTTEAPSRRPSITRVMLIERDRGDLPAGVTRRSAPTAEAVSRARAALEALGVEALTEDAWDPQPHPLTPPTHTAAEPGLHHGEGEPSRPSRATPSDIDMVLVLGGDGTILRASEIARRCDVPLLGINTGHVGFLAEAAPEAVEQVVADLVAGRYSVEERMTLSVEVILPDGSTERSWALNEAALEKRDRARMVEVAVGVDGQAVSSFGCDGLVVATPTGSTAYAFSAGGPVIWPEVEAIELVPLAAHALFTRPLVVSPRSCLEIVIQHAGRGGAEVWCDGRRSLPAPEGSRIRLSRSPRPVRLARLGEAPFSTRLVGKFDLPVSGWRALATHDG